MSHCLKPYLSAAPAFLGGLLLASFSDGHTLLVDHPLCLSFLLSSFSFIVWHVMSRYTGQPMDKIADDTDRDFFMTPQEALDYGIIDEVIKTKTSDIAMPPMPTLL